MTVRWSTPDLPKVGQRSASVLFLYGYMHKLWKTAPSLAGQNSNARFRPKMQQRNSDVQTELDQWSAPRSVSRSLHSYAMSQRTNEDPPDPVESPWVSQHKSSSRIFGSPAAAQETMEVAGGASNTPEERCRTRDYALAFRRYVISTHESRHDAGLQLQMAQARRASFAVATETAPSIEQIDINFLTMLKNAEWNGYQRSSKSVWIAGTSPRATSNQQHAQCWWLLRRLRSKSNDFFSQASDTALSSTLQQHLCDFAVARCTMTPCQVVQALSKESDHPMLRRRYALLQWLHECVDWELPVNSDRPLSEKLEANLLLKLLRPQDDKLPLSKHETRLLARMADLIVAGRLNDALQLARESGGQSYAAQFGGGAFQGVQERLDNDENGEPPRLTGNPRRFLWKLCLWQQAEKAHTASNVTNQRGPDNFIAALLSNHIEYILAQTQFSWQHRLCMLYQMAWDRVEDEVVRLHQQERATQPYCHASPEEVSDEFLALTHRLTTWSDMDFCQLAAQNTEGDIFRPTQTITLGYEYLLTWLEEQNMSEIVDELGPTLRFLTHLLLYVDARLHQWHQEPDSPISIADLDNLNQRVESILQPLLRAYIQGTLIPHAMDEMDIRYSVVLYTRFLPKLDWFTILPPFLAQHVVATKSTQLLLDPAFFSAGDERLLWWATLDHVLHDSEDDVVFFNSSLALAIPPTEGEPSIDDARQLRIVFTLAELASSETCRRDAIRASALVLRNCFMNGSYGTASQFVDQVENRLAVLWGNEEDTVTHQAVTRAREDCAAFATFLGAIKAYEEWKDLLHEEEDRSNIGCSNGSVIVDPSTLPSTAFSVYSQDAERTLAGRRVRDRITRVLKVSQRTHENLLNVLKHPGGWLFTGDEDKLFTDTIEFEETDSEIDALGILKLDDAAKQQRLKELNEIRRLCLPRVVRMYQHVAQKTARFLQATLDEGARQMNTSVTDTIAQLQEGLELVVCDDEQSALSPHLWVFRSFSILKVVASEESNVYEVFTLDDLKELLVNATEGYVSAMTS